jgi:hypothetical protein
MIITCLQWAHFLGDLTATFPVFCAAPGEGHLDCLNWMYAYLKNFSSAAIRVRVDTLDFAELPNQDVY